MNATNDVMKVMGEYTLMFFHVNAMRTHYKLLNDRGPNALAKMNMQKWHLAKKQMPVGADFFCVAVQTVPGTGKSGASYKIIGILSCYNTYDEAEGVSKLWRTKNKFLETEAEKRAWTRQFITDLKEWHNNDGDFSNATYDKFMEVTQ